VLGCGWGGGEEAAGHISAAVGTRAELLVVPICVTCSLLAAAFACGAAALADGTL